MRLFLTTTTIKKVFCLLIGLIGFILGAQAQVTNSGFESGTLDGWAGAGTVSVVSGFTGGNWNVSPAGTKMSRTEPGNVASKAAAEANLGLSAGSLLASNNSVFSTASNFGTLTQSVTLNAGQTLTLYWNYVSQDYAPYNDGILATLTGPSYQSIKLLAVTANAYGDAQAIVTGSYGSTNWHAVTFTAGAAGTYKVGFAAFNANDAAVNPLLFNDNAPGGTSGPGQPVVTTAQVTITSPSTATSGGNVTADGGATVSARGVCWSTSPQPTVTNDHTTNGTGTGAFTSTITGLTAGTAYYVRAYATNIAGTVYGAQVTIAADNVPPVITTNGNQNANTAANSCDATVAVSATATDNVSVGTPTGVRSDGKLLTDMYPAGTTTITWTVSDTNGNAALPVTQTVTVTDHTAPTVTTKPATLTLVGNTATLTVADVVVSKADNCDLNPVVTLSKTSFDCSNTGAPITITVSVTDANGNIGTATTTVTIIDNVVPVITTDGNKNVASDAAKCGATVVVSASATDNCTVGTPAGTRSDNQPLTADYPVGTTTITWNVADASGNAALAVMQTVTVTDTQKPTITAPAAITVSADAGQCSASKVALGTPVTADNCTVASVTNDAPTTFAPSATTVTWTVTDASGNVATATQTVTVVDKEKPVLTVPAALTRSTDATSCAAATGSWLGSATASDNCSGAVTLTNNAPASFPQGTTTVTYQAVDAAGNIATATQLVTITNDTPVINAVSGPVAPLPLSTTATMTASFTDNNLQSATWTWDDGTSSSGTISGTTVSGTHTYLSASVNHVLLTITDACGLTATKTFEYVVVYDPNGGFVTGGGSILSPVNTTLPYMQVGGKATFGFVAKYAKGSQVAGNTDFQFQAGNLTFKSSSLTDARLVIAGSLANYKGVGTINGAGNYGFMVAAVDGDYNKGTGPDKFRMKIWDVASGKIVYDNQAGDGEDAAASTAIASGSIVIHNANDKASAATASVRLLPDGSLNSSLETTALTSYPNPFSAQTTLAFSFTQAQDYTLAIYDLKGSLVQRVQASRAQAGQRYEVSLDAQALSSGLYVARLTTDAGVQTLKLVVQK
jgi:hypothetical protein